MCRVLSVGNGNKLVVERMFESDFRKLDNQSDQ